MIAARIPYMTAPGNHGNLIYTLHIICSSIPVDFYTQRRWFIMHLKRELLLMT